MKTILVIEDTPEMRENIAEVLQLAPYQVVPAANGRQGVEEARRVRPDLILCDIMMPELDGYGVLHILSKDPVTAGIPFIFLTAKAEAADFRYGMNLGADDYLIKPFDDVTLLNAVALRLKKGERGQPAAGPVAAELVQLLQAVTNLKEAHLRLGEYYAFSQYRKKQLLYREGNVPTALYFIRRGKVKLYKTDSLGKEYIVSLHGAGEFIGYLGLLEAATHAESAEILENAEICTIPKADFLSLIYHNQEVANQFVRLLVGEVSEHQQRLLKLAYQSVRKRVADALLQYQQKFYAPGVSTDSSPAIRLSRENWSQLVGASTEAVTRTLSDFRTEGLIAITNSNITILNAAKLARLKN